ncbi:MAG: dihydroorotate dehydrogenase [Actinobacteria bacterium]|nr:dihydroorotate dehydrogenase [Actinomycetota bacterium]
MTWLNTRRGFDEIEALGDITCGGVRASNPIFLASGTAGHGAELAPYMPLDKLGGIVVKSLSADAWPGNPAPRVHPTASGMLNSVGLQGDGVPHWTQHDLPVLEAVGATVVASIWGRSVADYARAAELLRPVSARLLAVEVNLSCPNLEGRSAIFAHDADLSAQVLAVVRAELPSSSLWAKLSANTDRIVEIAGSVHAAGADAVTLVNTMLGLMIDTSTRRPVLGNGGGGLSGRAIHPIAVRAIHDIRRAHSELPIVGVGGVSNGDDVIEMMLAGASFVQVGTATFSDPRSGVKILRHASRRARELGVTRWQDLVNAAH